MTEEERQAWNQVLRSGDSDAIEDMKDQLLISIHTRIMDGGNYHFAGWKRTTA